MQYFLKIDKVLNKDLIRKYGDSQILELLQVKKNLLVCDCSYSEFEIPINTAFNFLNTETNVYKIQFDLIYISIWSRFINIIPFGYKTVCVFQFSNSHDVEIFMDVSKTGNVKISTLSPNW